MAVETTTPPGSASVHHADGHARMWRWAVHPATLGVIALTVLGAVGRVVVAHQSVFADELSTYWISVTHGLGSVLKLLYSEGHIQHAEITPPLSFLASWLTTRVDSSPELLRLPALLAGTATIPLVYALGLRTVGRRAALLATALTTLSPFMIYYSAEARAYGLLMFLVLGSTLSMLLAIDTGRSRYWVLYAVCSAGAFYTHYTCVFVLGAQLVWVLWTEPRLRRVALFSNAGAALLVAPWIPGLIADARSPTVKILSALSAFSVHAVRLDIEHWAIGHPYAQLAIPNSTATGLRQVPGIPALILLALAGLVTAGGLAHRRAAIRPTRRAVLVVALMLATGVGECVFSAVGDHIIGVRDMAASWPFLALSAAAVVVAAGRWVAVAAGILTVGAFAIAASKMFVPRFERPDYQGAAAYVAARASARDVAIDETGYLVTPGPLTGFDVAFRGRPAVLRARAPAERDHPFSVFDRAVPLHAAESQAARQAVGGRIFVIGPTVPSAPFPGDYHLVAVRRYAGLEQLIVSEWSRSATAER